VNNPVAVAEHFKASGRITDIRAFGSGNINNTFLVSLDSEETKYFVLQQINTQVFHHPELIMQNIRSFSEHVVRKIHEVSFSEGRRWEVPQVLSTQEGEDYWHDSDGSFWRAITYIDNAQSFDRIKDISHGEEAGYALGMFHILISDLPVERLVDTLEGFHITPQYLQHYNSVTSKQDKGKSPEVNYCRRFVNDRSVWAHVLENAKDSGRLLLRPIHGDPKINNIMIDSSTGHAVSIIDLDTVKPGLVHYDIGDCLRSACNPLGEETGNPEAVRFETDLCKSILQRYISTASTFLTEEDYAYMYDAIRLLPFELGLRFFTDYLEGNVYFKATHEEHNLARALVQFRLTASIELQERLIRAIIKDMR
jgi:hypothetical protein